MKIVVTTGAPFTDIDALACAVSYTELLKNEGKDSEAVLPGHLNKSVTEKIKNWKYGYKKRLTENKAKYVLVDISDSKYFPSFVKNEDIIEIFDHRSGYEKYWRKRLGKNAKIEMVGSCATLIWEEYQKRSKGKISQVSANLLYTAIISNTLNLNASVTTKIDKLALKQLAKFTKLPKNWIAIYFKDQEKESYQDPRSAILNDTKGTGEKARSIVIGQLEFWDSKNFLKDHLKEIEKVLESFGKEKWFLTSPSISEGKNYIYTKNGEVKKLLEKTIGVKFKGDLGTTNKLWLRKEILKKLQES